MIQVSGTAPRRRRRGSRRTRSRSRPVAAALVEEVVDLVLRAAHDDRVELGALGAELLLVGGELDQLGMFLHARHTRRVEEVEHDPAALAPRQVERRAVVERAGGLGRRASEQRRVGRLGRRSARPRRARRTARRARRTRSSTIHGASAAARLARGRSCPIAAVGRDRLVVDRSPRNLSLDIDRQRRLTVPVGDRIRRCRRRERRRHRVDRRAVAVCPGTRRAGFRSP